MVLVPIMSLKSARMRLGNGKKIESTRDYQDYILELLKQRPRTPKEISKIVGKTPKTVQRWLKPMRENKEIMKIDGSDFYKIFNSNMSKRDIDQNKLVESSSEFMKSETAQRFLKKCGQKDKMQKLRQIQSICLGKSFPDVKLHPDNWIHPESTELIVQAWRKRSGKDKIQNSFKQLMRQWIAKGLGINLDSISDELAEMGLDGEKDQPSQSRLHMSDDQYSKAKKLCKNYGSQRFCKFGFRYWTFCRPSSMYLVKTDDLIFYDRTTEYIELKNGRKITDPDLIEEMRESHKVYVFTKRACTVPSLLENKTGESYTKYIYDDEISLALEEYVDARRKGGFKYLFWNDNTTVFTFENYDNIVKSEVTKDNEIFVEILLQCGFQKGDFGKTMRANYALRHFGVQWWLQATDYNYGLIADMGWKDITTLKLWYGQMTAKHQEKKLMGVVFNV